MKGLRNYPICGAEAVVLRNEPDGFFMGYSSGCPRYRLNDGVHAKKMFFHNVATKEKAIEKWNEYVERFLDEA